MIDLDIVRESQCPVQEVGDTVSGFGIASGNKGGRVASGGASSLFIFDVVAVEGTKFELMVAHHF